MVFSLLERRLAQGDFAVAGNRRGKCAAALVFAIAAMLLAPARESKATDAEVWQVTPYRVQVLAAFERGPALTPALEKDFCADLLARTESVVGAPWDIFVVPAPAEQRGAILHSLDEITVEQAAKFAGNFDKIMFLAVKPENGALRATVREFDVRSLQLGPPAIRTAWHLGKIRDAALDAILAAFSPLANIDSVKDKTAILHLKAAGLPSRDPALAVIQPGMIFRAYIRVNDREGKARRVTPVAWTFLVVDKATAERLDCRIESGMATPLNAKRRTRIEQLALAIHPTRTPSVLVLQSRIEPKEPLPGYQIYEYDKESKDTALLGRTDWQGQLSIPPTKKVLRFLAVKNGGEPLAHFPFVPGLDPIVTADIANDDYRLQAEGFVIGLQEQLVDLYAHRELLRRGALNKLDAGEVDQAKELFAELSRLPTGKVFSMKLAEEKKKLDTKDTVVQLKIDKLFTETKKLVDRCLDDKPIEELADDLRGAKQGVVKKPESEEP
jgi:hypothetical protein